MEKEVTPSFNMDTVLGMELGTVGEVVGVVGVVGVGVVPERQGHQLGQVGLGVHKVPDIRAFQGSQEVLGIQVVRLYREVQEVREGRGVQRVLDNPVYLGILEVLEVPGTLVCPVERVMLQGRGVREVQGVRGVQRNLYIQDILENQEDLDSQFRRGDLQRLGVQEGVVVVVAVEGKGVEHSTTFHTEGNMKLRSWSRRTARSSLIPSRGGGLRKLVLHKKQ